MKKGFDRIIGYEAIKTELARISDSLKNNEAYAKLGVSAPKGLLLYGEPGVGKTIMANAVIEESGRKAFVCRKDLPNGAFVKAIKSVFAKAKEAAPSIVFLDDMDKFANGDEEHPDAEEYITVQSCIDALKGSEVFVLATANSIESLPFSLLRAGRFDRVIEVEAPRDEDAVKIVEHYLDRKGFVSGIDAVFLARVLDGRSCAELETVINEAGLYAGYERKGCITMDHFLEACLRMLFDVPPTNNSVKGDDWHTALSDGNDTRSQIVYHEAGHAVISEVLFPQSVTLVSTHSVDGRFGGFTSCYRDRKIAPLLWQQRNIVVGLGGMAAVEQKYGIADSGAERDLDQAFDMVRDLVVNNCVCGFSLHEANYRISETLRSRQEQIVASEIEKYYRKAKQILACNRGFLDGVAAALAQKHLLSSFDIEQIKNECEIVAVAM